ncbi:platelet endothelial aggregation receptor 1-like [Saccostrea echinata]|uniref:platelet endothelial aggregation receptor 1-like n=1 Tax=Saccostrea echinata TaxID=191078 RepID=UPI002A82811C|nr:platelet endothelial aggregation receptor 1-like [Saccostrea echinata]
MNTEKAENAVNGLKSDLTRWSGHCAISDDNIRAATLGVNLKSILSIHHIKVYYRTDNVKWGPSNGYTARFLGFYLYVSNTTNRNDGYLCYHDTTYTRATIPPVVNIACPVYGQYVIYYNERLAGVRYPSDYSTFAFTEVCEIEVYGCREGICPYEYCKDCLYKQCLEGDNTCKKVCPVAFNGKKCEKSCSSHCLNSSGCDSKSGACQGGCEAGWKGLLCINECGSSEYGRNCRRHCGPCRYKNKCNPIDGSCPAGCAEGYAGKTCSMSN